MNSVGDKVSLSAFLAHVDAALPGRIEGVLASLQDRLDYLRAALTREPEIRAQVDKLSSILPATLSSAGLSERQVASRISADLINDLKERWIDAQDPPLVDEIDAHFRALNADLDRLQQPGRQELQAIAAQIDGFAAPGTAIEGIEKRYLPWGIGAAILFLLGLVMVFIPAALHHIRILNGFWPILVCFGALPALGMHFAYTIRHRTRADQKIDALNKEHFLPQGGLYFPAGATPAGVVLVEWTPPEKPEPGALKDPRKTKEHQRSL